MSDDLILFKMRRILCFGLAAVLSLQVPALKIASNLQWIEHTPQPYAIQNFYKGDTATMVSGGVASLSDKTVDLGANAETQGLKQYARNKNYRLIYVIVEATYRIVANKAGVRKLSDLKGKRIATAKGSSAEVFVHTFLASAGLGQDEYTTVGSGAVCMKAPCSENSLPGQLKSKKIDAFGLWETTVELAVQSLGEQNVIVFKNASIYREIYSLYSTTEKLQDPKTRKKIVSFVKALNQTLDIYNNDPEKVYPTVGRISGVDVPILRKVWADHKWGPGSLGNDLLDFLYREDQYLSKQDRRSAMSRAELARFIDPSVYEDAKKL